MPSRRFDGFSWSYIGLPATGYSAFSENSSGPEKLSRFPRPKYLVIACIAARERGAACPSVYRFSKTSEPPVVFARKLLKSTRPTPDSRNPESDFPTGESPFFHVPAGFLTDVFSKKNLGKYEKKF
jgi:hypothetical protein